MQAKELAHLIGTDGKTFRRFLRARGASAGKGRTYDIRIDCDEDVNAYAEMFADWQTNSGGGAVSIDLLGDEA